MQLEPELLRLLDEATSAAEHVLAHPASFEIGEEATALMGSCAHDEPDDEWLTLGELAMLRYDGDGVFKLRDGSELKFGHHLRGFCVPEDHLVDL